MIREQDCLSAADGQEELLPGCPRIDHFRARLQHEMSRRMTIERELSDAQDALSRAQGTIALLETAVRQAQQRASHDSLTQLPNRGYFLETLMSAVFEARAEGSTLAMLFLDLDDFKRVNDTHGHPFGDALLRIVGARLRQSVRDGDIVGRVGGDEFACLLPGITAISQAKAVGFKLLSAVSMPAKIYSLTIQVGVSIGIAMYPTDGRDADALLRRADAAMYHAKRQRCGCAAAEDMG